MDKFVCPEDFAIEIQHYWENHPYQQKDLAFPGIESLNRLLCTSYIVSCMQEESRSLRMRIAYISQTQLIDEKFNNERTQMLQFAHCREFSAAELQRLAPATNHDKTYICVMESNKNRELVIPSLLTSRTNMQDMDSGAALEGWGLPDLFNIEIIGPGKISISRGEFCWLKLVDGKISYPLGNFVRGRSDDTGENTNPITQRLRQTENQIHEIACAELLNEGDIECSDREHCFTMSLYFSFIQRILYGVKNIRHGGTLIITPDEEPIPALISIKYGLNNNSTWQKQVEWVKKLRKQMTGEAVWKELNEIHQDLIAFADFLAKLTAVDGAVLLTNKLRVLGFGVEIQIYNSTLSSISLYSNGKSEIISIEKFGTRHRSAYRFCYEYPGSIVFIMSQDGSLKTAMRIENELCVWLLSE